MIAQTLNKVINQHLRKIFYCVYLNDHRQILIQIRLRKNETFTSLSLSLSKFFTAGCALIIACVLAGSQAHANEDPASGQSAADLSAASTVKSIAKPNEPIKDREGRIRYIVDLVDDNVGRPDKFADSDSYVAYTKDKSTRLIEDVSKLRGAELFGMTTGLIGTSFIAHLTEQQVKQFANDKRVKLITQDVYIQSSALWNSSTDSSGQVRPWGLQAMAVANASSSNGGATVFVLDYGVEMHADLTGLATFNRLSAMPGISPTGCYAHATHVAGIIGAADNGGGVVGVLPGAKLVSIGMGGANSGSCAPIESVTAATVALAFQKASEFLYNNNISSSVGIINLSFNAGGGIFASSSSLGQKMLSVSTPFSIPGVRYKGALIVQSAGNQFSDACDYAYNAPAAGIIVVGGLDDNGQSVRKLNGIPGYAPPLLPNQISNENGSNYGGCVGIWAPSQRVLSTFGGNSYFVLSGTSMAAPHISGFAARLLESNPSISTPAALKSAVLSYATTIAGSNLAMPRLSLQATTATPTVEVAEGIYGQGALQSGVSTVIFTKFASQVALRYEAVGATSCLLTVTRNGALYSSGYYPTTYTIGANLLPTGQVTWSVTCTSPQGTQSTAAASGTIKRTVSGVSWVANTTSTGGVWQTIPNGGTVTWSVSANASFSQYYTSVDADYCQILSRGFFGNTYADTDNPAFSPFVTNYSQTLLWNSGLYYPNYYNFGSFQLGNPNTAPPPLGPYDGYKWFLTCRNSEGSSQTAVMYGKAQP